MLERAGLPVLESRAGMDSEEKLTLVEPVFTGDNASQLHPNGRSVTKARPRPGNKNQPHGPDTAFEEITHV